MSYCMLNFAELTKKSVNAAKIKGGLVEDINIKMIEDKPLLPSCFS